MPALLATALAWLARVVVPLFGMSRLVGLFVQLAKFGLFTVGLPLAFNWGVFKVCQNFSPLLFSTLGLSAHTISLTGLTAWLGSALKIPVCLSVFLGFVAQAYVVKLSKMGGPLSKFTTDRFS